MLAKDYAGYDPHKAEHETLISICAGLQTKFHAGETEVIVEVGQMVKG